MGQFWCAGVIWLEAFPDVIDESMNASRTRTQDTWVKVQRLNLTYP